MVIGIDLDGNKDVLGMWIGENESSKFWLSVLDDLRNRGVQDILIICVDNLSGPPKRLRPAIQRPRFKSASFTRSATPPVNCRTRISRKSPLTWSRFTKLQLRKGRCLNWTASRKSGASSIRLLSALGATIGGGTLYLFQVPIWDSQTYLHHKYDWELPPAASLGKVSSLPMKPCCKCSTWARWMWH